VHLSPCGTIEMKTVDVLEPGIGALTRARPVAMLPLTLACVSSERGQPTGVCMCPALAHLPY
jgi:hypothetical protein